MTPAKGFGTTVTLWAEGGAIGVGVGIGAGGGVMTGVATDGAMIGGCCTGARSTLGTTELSDPTDLAGCGTLEFGESFVRDCSGCSANELATALRLGCGRFEQSIANGLRFPNGTFESFFRLTFACG